MASILERAGAIADDVLFPAALDVDAEGAIPRSHFDLLAEEGFYGLAGQPEHGGIKVGFPSLVSILRHCAAGASPPRSPGSSTTVWYGA